MGNLSLTIACGGYDRTEALRYGMVQPEGIDLTYLAIQSPPEIFRRMIKKNSFHFAEMSTSMYLQLRSKGDFPFVALPIFPSRVFRHGFIFINKNANIQGPRDLAGKRIGVQEYYQTAGVWIRGILQHEYGVNLDDVRWYEGGVNAPRDPDVMDLRPAGNPDLDIQFIPKGETLSDMLATGEIDAMLGARKPFSLMSRENVVRLFPDYREEEKKFYRKTGIFPMMHTLVMQESLYEEKPWVAESVYKAFVAAKDWCLEEMRFSGTMRYMLPWLFADLDEMDEVFGNDPWPYGLEPNRKALETLIQYLVDQRFLNERVDVEDMFVPIVMFNE